MYAKIKSRREKNEKHEQRQSDSNGWMKKNRRYIVASAVMGVAVIVLLIFSSPRVDGNLKFNVYDGEAEVIGSSPVTATGNYKIPAKFRGLPVTKIGHDAFKGCTALTVYCTPGFCAWQYCEKNKIPHKPLDEQPQEGAAQAPAETSEAAPAVPSRKRRSPLAWLLPLILVLLAAGAAWYFGFFETLLGLLG